MFSKRKVLLCILFAVMLAALAGGLAFRIKTAHSAPAALSVSAISRDDAAIGSPEVQAWLVQCESTEEGVCVLRSEADGIRRDLIYRNDGCMLNEHGADGTAVDYTSDGGAGESIVLVESADGTLTVTTDGTPTEYTLTQTQASFRCTYEVCVTLAADVREVYGMNCSFYLGSEVLETVCTADADGTAPLRGSFTFSHDAAAGEAVTQARLHLTDKDGNTLLTAAPSFAEDGPMRRTCTVVRDDKGKLRLE